MDLQLFAHYTKMVRSRSNSVKKDLKRKIDAPVDVQDDFDVEGLIDEGDSDDEDEQEEQEESAPVTTVSKTTEEDEEADDESDSDAELEAMIGEEEDLSGSELDDELAYFSDAGDDEVDPSILSHLEDGLRLRSLSRSSDQTDELKDVVEIIPGADGKPRMIKKEIHAVYDSDDSDMEESNTIGNVPLSAYDQMPHIGYDINGKRIMRPATGSALDTLLESIDLPEGWTGLLDKSTGKGLNISKEELELIKRIQRNETTDDASNPYEDLVEWFSSKTEIMPLSAAPEPKRRFVPSKHEAKRVMKMVQAIRQGKLLTKPKEDPNARPSYDVWADNLTDVQDHVMTLRAPKMPPPTHDESYNPPAEYLPTEEEIAEWNALAPSERERNYVPKKFAALRHVPGYSESVRERFERSLDLYLAPRVRKNKLNIDPDSLIPDLPSPKDLMPFPIRCATTYKGHKGKVRAISVDPSGEFLATGGDDGTLRVWEVLTGRELYRCRLVASIDAQDDSVECVQWNPAVPGMLAASAGEHIFLIVPPTLFDFDIENVGREKIEQGWGFAEGGRDQQGVDTKGLDDDADSDSDDDSGPIKKKSPPAKWITPTAKQQASGIGAIITATKTIKRLAWHRKGDYLVTVAPTAQHRAVAIHQISKHSSQSPFNKSKGIVQDAMFHPFRPHLYVATQRYVRIYDLAKQVMAKKLMPGARWVSSLDIHPRGDNVILSSFDKRLLWHDLDLSDKPYKTLRYHEKAVRHAAFHKGGLPLFCSASDDGNINIFHGTVYDDMMTNPLLVPLKVLKGHDVKSGLGILRVEWHPREAWLFSAAADGTAKLWTT